jgi:hypothetical protein
MNQGIILFLFLGLIIIVVSFSFIPTSDLFGYLLILGSFISLFASKACRKDRRLFSFLAFSLMIRHIISLINVYYTSVYGGELDAATFHRIAGEYAFSLQPVWSDDFASLDTGSRFYGKSLGLVYKYLGHSLLLGQALSILAHTFSALILLNMTRYLGLTKWQKGIALLYGLLPPSIIFASFTMREAWEILFFTLICYYAIRLRERISNFRIISIIVYGIGLGFLHNGLLIYSIFLISFSLLWGARFNLLNWNVRNVLAKILAFFLLAGVIYGWWIMASDLGGASRAIVSGETSTYYGTYREKGEQGARANYDVKLDTSSIPLAIGTGFIAFIFYLFAPFPWQINTATDLYAFMEGVFRFFLLYNAFKLWWRTTGERKRRFRYLLICAVTLELLWSFGTANWGTAIRHHIVAYGLLVILGGPGVMLSLINVYKRIVRVRIAPKRKAYLTRPTKDENISQAKLPLRLPPNVPKSSI